MTVQLSGFYRWGSELEKELGRPDADYCRGPKDHINIRTLRPCFLEAPLSWALEPESRILVCIWFLGPLHNLGSMRGTFVNPMPC